MRVKLKPLKDQVMVITGASSGIDLVTARMAARRGARVALVARNEEALRRICEDIRAQGGDATSPTSATSRTCGARPIPRSRITAASTPR